MGDVGTKWRRRIDWEEVDGGCGDEGEEGGKFGKIVQVKLIHIFD
jgi:hypothetical protein